MEPKLTRASIKAYLNYFRILVAWAVTFGWMHHSPELEQEWAEIRAAVSPIVGARRIVDYAIRLGVRPVEFTDKNLQDWVEEQVRRGREYGYVIHVKALFVRRLLKSGLNTQLPQLSFELRQDYGIPLKEFPENLRAEVETILAWKQADYDPDRYRPERNRHSPSTALHLRYYFSRLYGFVNSALGKSPITLCELLSETNIKKFIPWLRTERGVRPETIIGDLRFLRPLRSHPLLEKWEHEWLDKQIAALPRGSGAEAQDREEARWVSFGELAKIPAQILVEARDLNDPTKKALAVRDALLIAWWLVFAWRQRNIRECRLGPSAAGGNLWKGEVPHASPMATLKSMEAALKADEHAKFWQFRFVDGQTKTRGRQRRAFIPVQLVSLLEEYLEHWRPVLVGARRDPGTLFVNNAGGAYGLVLLTRRIERITMRYTGRGVNPHLIRHILSTALLEDHPDDSLTLVLHLWHSARAFGPTTFGVYARRFDESYAARRVEEWLLERYPCLTDLTRHLTGN